MEQSIKYEEFEKMVKEFIQPTKQVNGDWETEWTAFEAGFRAALDLLGKKLESEAD